MKNIANIQTVLTLIESNPSCWNQKEWHCGTSHCFAGHAQIQLTGGEDTGNVKRDARIYFGFTASESDYYFNYERTLPELKTALRSDALFYDNDGLDQNNNPRP